MTPITQTDLSDLKLVHRGKVREMYDVGTGFLMVATDRISAHDVIMEEPIPNKGEVLTSLSLFWFDLQKNIAPNHLITADVSQYPEICKPYAHILYGRSMLVKKAEPLPVECIVRGYISGSFWKAYKKSADGIVCGFQLPEGMQESGQFPEPLFTPSTKAEQGLHDENISFDKMCELIGPDVAAKAREISLRYYIAEGMIVG